MTSGHFEFVIQFLDQIRVLLRPRSNCNIDNNLFMAISETPIHPELHVNGEAKLILPAGYDCQSDEQSWWLAFSRSFHTLMDKASYSKEQQMKYASFVFQNIIPFLGPAPAANGLPHFDSFCNDDFSPVELSWNFHAGRSTVRIGFEPIGRMAGTPRDPFNTLQPATAMAHLLRIDPRVDDGLWRHFCEDLIVAAEQAPAVVQRMAPNEHMSSNTISFDLSGAPLPKVYFYPVAAALAAGEHGGEMVCRSLDRLGLNLTPALDIIRAYVAEAKARHGESFARLECLSFDAIEPAQSRFKLYIRTAQTSLASTCELFTLGGRLDSPEIRACLANIRSFWSLVLHSQSENVDLPPSTHRTAGIIFNFELRHNDPTPRPKVYIPTRHYGGTDLRVAQGLSEWFRAIGWSKTAESYVQDVQDIL